MTHAVMNARPSASQSIPQGLLVPWAKTSNVCVPGSNRQIPALIGTRSLSGVPGLPTRECVKTPWQPYSRPSGPQAKELSISCVSCAPQPSRTTTGAASGTSSPS